MKKILKIESCMSPMKNPILGIENPCRGLLFKPISLFPACRPLAAGLLVLDVSRAQPQGACEAGVQTSLGVPKKCRRAYDKNAPPICGRSISFLVIFESNVSFETVFGGLWEHSRISDYWKHSFYSERLLYVIQLNSFAFVDETETCFWRNRSFLLSHNTVWESTAFVQWTHISAF